LLPIAPFALSLDANCQLQLLIEQINRLPEENFFWSERNYTAESLLRYECEDGFEFEDGKEAQMVECQWDSGWNMTNLPQCQRENE